MSKKVRIIIFLTASGLALLGMLFFPDALWQENFVGIALSLASITVAWQAFMVALFIKDQRIALFRFMLMMFLFGLMVYGAMISAVIVITSGGVAESPVFFAGGLALGIMGYAGTRATAKHPPQEITQES